MLPIIRRHRTPLLSETPKPVAPPSPSSPAAAEVTRLKSPATGKSTDSPAPPGSQLPAPGPSLPPPSSAVPSTALASPDRGGGGPKSKKRSGFGPFRSDPPSPPSPSSPAAAEVTRLKSPATDKSTDSPAPPGSQRSAPGSSLPAPSSEPPSLWSRQPDEPADAYQLFHAWLQLPVRRPHKLAAAKLGCSVRRLSQFAARYRWKTRAAAFDNHRANAASEALDRLLNEEELDWKQRAQRFRLQEWLLHEQMFHAADHAIREFEKHPWRASLNDLVKLS